MSDGARALNFDGNRDAALSQITRLTLRPWQREVLSALGRLAFADTNRNRADEEFLVVEDRLAKEAGYRGKKCRLVLQELHAAGWIAVRRVPRGKMVRLDWLAIYEGTARSPVPPAEDQDVDPSPPPADVREELDQVAEFEAIQAAVVSAPPSLARRLLAKLLEWLLAEVDGADQTADHSSDRPDRRSDRPPFGGGVGTKDIQSKACFSKKNNETHQQHQTSGAADLSPAAPITAQIGRSEAPITRRWPITINNERLGDWSHCDQVYAALQRAGYVGPEDAADWSGYWLSVASRAKELRSPAGVIRKAVESGLWRTEQCCDDLPGWRAKAAARRARQAENAPRPRLHQPAADPPREQPPPVGDLETRYGRELDGLSETEIVALADTGQPFLRDLVRRQGARSHPARVPLLRLLARRAE